MALNPQQLLSAVEEAIAAILQGRVASASENARAYTRLDLGTLYEMRKDLLSEVAAANRRQPFMPVRRVNL